MDHLKSGLGRWNSLEEELDALEINPTAQDLLTDLEDQDPERIDLLLAALETQAALEGDGYEQAEY
jgi:hypothetical protein